jgi:hypothetical protein
VPVRGAVKIPDGKSKALPMLSLATWKGIAIFVVLKELFLWT